MNKALIQSLLTGILAKLIRYTLATSGGVMLAAAIPGNKSIDPGSVAEAVAPLVVALLWSLYEDRVKRGQTAQLTPSIDTIAPIAGDNKSAEVTKS